MKNLKNNLQPHYKKIDRSTLEYGITIPKGLETDFLAGKKLALGSSRDINIKWEKHSYEAKLIHTGNNNGDYYGIKYQFTPDLLKKLRKT